MAYFYCECTMCAGHLCLEEDKERLDQLHSKSYKGSSMSKYKPISDKVLIKINTQDEKTAGGLFIPDSVTQDIRPGIVEAVGPGRWDGQRVPMTVKVGDKVHIGKFSGVALGDKDHVVVREEEILAIEEEDGK